MGNYTIKAKKIIEEYLKENEISKSRFCRLCKIPVREFKHLFDYRHSVNNDTFYKMAQTMEVEVEQLFVGIKEDCLEMIKNLQLGLKVDFSKVQTLSKIQNKSSKLPNSDI